MVWDQCGLGGGFEHELSWRNCRTEVTEVQRGGVVNGVLGPDVRGGVGHDRGMDSAEGYSK